MAAKKMENIGIVWLILGPVLIVLFNLLQPHVGIQPTDPQNAEAYLGKLAANGDSIRIYSILILFGFIIYTGGILRLSSITPDGEAKIRMNAALILTVASLALSAVFIGLTLGETDLAEKGAAAAAAGNAAGSATYMGYAGTLHAAAFGVNQAFVYVASLSVLVLGLASIEAKIINVRLSQAIALVGLVGIVVTSIWNINTEEGVTIVGYLYLIWALLIISSGVTIYRNQNK
ncbi:MAG: hypothetical protein CL903_00350 [Dehalococcoidia bacterium]|nr:hypothetical protein [Dehalococcoidia bacterium]MQG08898.1 hypothetical protein [SAR202 cluster bacterium]|tara:strand:- start:2485 stop:3180 length:696 start_codon:yes stop_codon:yes gene_type:complete